MTYYLISSYLPCEMRGSLTSGVKPGSPTTKVEKLLNLYGSQLGLGGSFGHKFVNIFLDELVWWDGVVKQDGVWGGIIWGSMLEASECI